MIDDLFTPLTPSNPASPKPKCRRHRWGPAKGMAGHYSDWECERCGALQHPDAIRRGRNNRQRGNAIEREVGKRLGMRRVGQYGGPDDLSNDLFAAQVKSGGYFSERQWGWLKAVPVKAGQTPLLIIVDTPGPGIRRRGMVILDLDSWRELHGETA